MIPPRFPSLGQLLQQLEGMAIVLGRHRHAVALIRAQAAPGTYDNLVAK